LFSKRKNKNHLWILRLCMIRERLFSLCRGLKCVFVLEYLWLTVTILCRAVLENANAISIHVAGFKHKIYRWLRFLSLWDSHILGRSKKEFNITLLCCVVIEMSVMQILLLNRYKLRSVFLVTKLSSMHCWDALGWKCSEVQNLDSIFLSVTVRKRKRCFCFSFVINFANNIF